MVSAFLKQDELYAWPGRFPLCTTLKMSLVSLLMVVIGAVISYILARREFMGKWLIDVLVTLPMILHKTVIEYMLVFLLEKRGIIGQLLFNTQG
ncbi:hypothetical protein [uncultured Methanomethylovorans sp.]|uniref:hypothetical protein n=1 Tax=uncultured Methanomethylovorans sp. TaxID=183759 RepID=UPI002AA6C1E5|nr:hypothetical protein [uncultured Methanomethylovorans sp.]